MMNKVLIGLSGGVDSAVSALLLKKAGYEVTGCRLILNDTSAQPEEDRCARDAADKLGIELITADFRKEFKKNVSEHFVSEYLNGRTPNPCVRCNPTVKFASLKKVADENGFPFIATGHYALIHKDEATGLCAIKTSPSKKDQSYFLYRLGQDILQRVFFPLGGFSSKDEIRSIGRAAGFESAEKKDSQEVCFIPDDDYAGYIRRAAGLEPVPGDFISPDGSVIGRHNGVIYYTVGQRKGLGAFGEPRYVKSINAKDNTVTLCKADERFADIAVIKDVFWTFRKAPESGKTFGVKIRSTAKAVPASLEMNGESVTIHFSAPVMAPCPGQSAVIYDGDVVIGGGEIINSEFGIRNSGL